MGDAFSMADIAMAPYVNRLDALAMDGLWSAGRLPGVERWFARVKERPTFKPALLDWMPPELAAEMKDNGRKWVPRSDNFSPCERSAPDFTVCTAWWSMRYFHRRGPLLCRSHWPSASTAAGRRLGICGAKACIISPAS